MTDTASGILKLNNFRPKWRFALWISLVLSLLFYGAHLWQQGAKIQSDILAILPHLSQDKLSEQALDQVEQRLGNQVYLALLAGEEQAAIQSANLLMQTLKTESDHAFSKIQSGDNQQISDLGAFYYQHRFHLLTQAQAEAISSGHWQTLLASAQAQLYSAFGFASSKLLAEDPLLLLPDNLLALSPNHQFQQQQGVLLTTTSTGFAAIVMAKGRDSAFSPVAQQAQMDAINQGIARVSQDYPDTQILKAGALFHASAATQSAKWEMSRIGGISLIGVLLLVWLAFRSLMPLVLALLTLSCGLLSALIATLSVFGELHLLTLVFGTSLIGMAIDYSFHFYCEKLNTQGNDAGQVIAKITPAMTLALMTSVSAFIAIGFTPFPGMQQVAVFCAAGLVGAYLTIILAFPMLAKSPVSHPRGLTLAHTYLNALHALFSHKAAQFVLLTALSCIMILGLSRLSSNDDIRNLQQAPQAITDEENQLRQLLSGGTDNQFILARSHDEQALLQLLAQLEPVLVAAKDAGEVTQTVSLARFIPSISQQQDNYRLQRKLYEQHLDEIIASMGLTSEISAKIMQALHQAEDNYMTPANVLELANEDMRTLWLERPLTSENALQGDTEFGAIVLLGGINNLAALTQRLNAMDWQNGQVNVIDKVSDISALMGEYRQLTLQLLLWVFALASLLFSIKYGVKLAFAIVAVPMLAIALTLACLGFVDSNLSLFHALALILVLGIGIDYGLFFAEPNASNRGVMMAVFMSACSTLLAFGLLSLSQTNAIHFFGLTLLFGIAFTFLLAPFISFITRKTL
jgi:predicted exporter